MSKSGALTPEQNQRVRAAAQRIRRDQCGENDSALARKLGVKQPTISRFMSGAQGTSLEVATKIAALAGSDVSTLLGLPGDVDSQASPRRPEVRHVPGYAEAVAKAKQLFRRYPPDAYEELGSIAGFDFPARLDEYVIQQLLDTVMAMREARARGADPAQAALEQQLDVEDAAADAAHAEAKARAASAEGHTPKPGSAVRKKGGR